MTLNKIVTLIRKSYKEAKHCRYPGLRYKIKIFKILLSLHLKSNSKATGKPVLVYLFGYKVTGPNYKEILFQFQEVAVKLQYQFYTNNPSAKIIDCGANIGLSILFFKILYPRSIILAFEPNPDTYQFLVKNVKQNKLRNVKLFNTCLSETNGAVDFYPSDNSIFSSLYPHSGHQDPIKVQSQKLSDLLSTGSYDLIKMDVEGTELAILQDLEKTGTLQNASQYLVAYHNKSDDASKVLSIFTSNGFQHQMRSRHYEVKDNSNRDILIAFQKV